MPDFFVCWMDLLKQVSGSVLWLYSGQPTVQENLRKQAALHGVSADRLHFASYMPVQEHLARLGQADVMLDNLPVNAHTTTSDALWVGVPVVTCLGETFTGRVAASLLHAVDLPELVTADLQAYKAKALELATNDAYRLQIRDKLRAGRSRFALFDTAQTTRYIEAAYMEMVARHEKGEAPAAFSVQA